MASDTLTVESVKQTLRALARGEYAPDLLPDAFELRESREPAERTRRLRRYLTDLAATQLRDLRARMPPADRPRPADPSPSDTAEGATPADVSAVLARDFACANPSLEAWSALYYRYLCDAEMSVEALAAAAHVSERQFRRRVAAGVELLTEQLRLADLAAQGRLRRLHLDRYLPPPDYLQLFGIQEQIATAMALLTDPAGPSIVAFEGLGGIGKTTLAQAVAQRLAESGPFVAVLWVSAQQHRLLPGAATVEALPEPALTFSDLVLQLLRQLERDDLAVHGANEWERRLQAFCHAAPYLIVVDNLETLADHRALVPRLRRMLGVSRALLTSRQSLSEYTFVRSLPVPPLSPADSLALVRSELMRAGRYAETPHDGGLAEVCALAGGLPLALKLIAGLLNQGVPLGQIRDDVRRASGAAYALYTYIYRRTWSLLPEAARQLLVDMLLVAPDGEDLDWIASTSRLPADELRAALAHLLNHCLLQITGSLERPFYRLHPLTAIFLQSDLVAGWAEGQAP